jgi:hypothetical protein
MGFASESGYTPSTIQTMMLSVMANINTQFGTSYTAETFVGTNFYKYFYALMQKAQENEVKASEIFLKLQDYIELTNERISRPVVTNPGVIEKLSTEGWVASVKQPSEAEAGEIHICVDADDGDHAAGDVVITSFANLIDGTDDTVTIGATAFTAQSGAATPGDATFQAATSNEATATSLAAQINAHATAGALVRANAFGAMVRLRALAGGTAGNSVVLTYQQLGTGIGATVTGSGTLEGGTASATYEDDREAICEIIKDSTVAGCVTQGTETEAIVLTNGQSFDFKYFLPNKIDALLRLTLTLSENNQVVIDSPEDVKAALIANIDAKYNLGRNFEPQKYFSVVDAPWCSQVLLEYSLDDGTTWLSAVYDAEFDDLFLYPLLNISVVEE